MMLYDLLRTTRYDQRFCCYVTNDFDQNIPICPICGKDKFDGLDADIWADWMPNFCPHCGARMEEGKL